MENRINRAAPSRTERDAGSSSADAPPPIPDGGLAASMPEWLQRPPAWRGMTIREPERRELPPPDTSVIDPRTMLRLDDLPEWLQRIAARSGGAGTAEGVDEDPAIAPPEEGHARAVRVEQPEGHARTVRGREPVKPPVADRPTGEPVSPSASPQVQTRPIVLQPSPASRPTGWWRSSFLVACLAIAILLILIVIWLILVAR